MIHLPSSSNGFSTLEKLPSTSSKKITEKTATGSTMTQEDSLKGQEFKQEIRQQSGRKFPSLFSLFSSAPKSEVVTGQMGGQVKFVGTSAAAKQVLSSLIKQLPHNEEEESGILRLMHATRKGQEMTFQLKKPNDAHATRAAKMEVTAAYVQSILKTAYPRESFEAYATIHDEFQNYLQKSNDKITLPELQIRLERFDQAEAEISTISPFYQDDINNTPAEKITADLSSTDFLRAKGIEINTSKPMGVGAFGTVFAAKMGDKEYVYKEQKEATPLNHPELNDKFWRTGDIAASRLKDLPHFAKAASFVLEIQETGKPAERWHLPTSKVKEFGQALPPGTTVKLLGQVMERAPGKELHALLELPSTKFNKVEHVDAIAGGLYRFLERTTERNFIHRDIKPANILYDPATKEMTVIDAGLGAVYAKPGKSPTRAPNANPSLSNMQGGTRFYITRSIAEGEDYGNEVDFHSSALTLLEVLDPVELSRAVRTLAQKKPREFVTSTASLRRVLEQDNSLVKKLNANPDLEKKINLFFNVAHTANKEDRQKAYQRLQSAMTNTPLPEALQEGAPRLEEATDYEAFQKLYGF